MINGTENIVTFDADDLNLINGKLSARVQPEWQTFDDMFDKWERAIG